MAVHNRLMRLYNAASGELAFELPRLINQMALLAVRTYYWREHLSLSSESLPLSDRIRSR
jgi:hypothetical protein